VNRYFITIQNYIEGKDEVPTHSFRAKLMPVFFYKFFTYEYGGPFVLWSTEWIQMLLWVLTL